MDVRLVVLDDDSSAARIVTRMQECALRHGIKLTVSVHSGREKSETSFRAFGAALRVATDLLLVMAHGSRTQTTLSNGLRDGDRSGFTRICGEREKALDPRRPLQCKALITLICGQNRREVWRTAMPSESTLMSTNWKLLNSGIIPLVDSVFSAGSTGPEALRIALARAREKVSGASAAKTLRTSNWTIGD